MTNLKALEKVREHITWIIDQYAEQCMTTFPIPTRAAEAKAIIDQLIEREKEPVDSSIQEAINSCMDRVLNWDSSVKDYIPKSAAKTKK